METFFFSPIGKFSRKLLNKHSYVITERQDLVNLFLWDLRKMSTLYLTGKVYITLLYVFGLSSVLIINIIISTNKRFVFKVKKKKERFKTKKKKRKINN